jgi:WD40 repeat protein
VSVITRVSLFALGPLVSTACKAAGLSVVGESAAAVVRFLRDRVSDQSLRVTAALADASDRAWRTLELALAGESLVSATDRAEDRAFREEVRLFVLRAQFDGRAPIDADLVPRCLEELRAARAAGVLDGNAVPDHGDLTRFADPAGLVAAEWKVAEELATDLRRNGFPALASFLMLRPAGDPAAVPLLAVAVRHHFRRAVEDDPKLFQGLAFAQLERISKAQEDGAAQLAELMSRYVERLETRLGELKDTALTTRAEVRELRELVCGRTRSLGEVGCIPVAIRTQANPVDNAPGAPNVLSAHSGAVACVAVSPDGTRAVTGGADHGLWVWDLANRRELRCLAGHRDRVCCVAFSPDGRRVLSSGLDQTVRLWDPEAGLELKCFDRQTNRSAAFAPDGKTALCGALYDGKLRVFDTTTGKEVRRLPGHADWVVCVAFAADGKVALSGGLDKTIKLWDVPTGRLLRTFTLKNVVISSVAFSPDGWRVLSAGSDGIVRGWDTFTGQELFRLVGHTDAVSCVAVSPDGDRAASAGHDGTVRLWDIRLKKEVQRLEGHSGNVLCVAFTPDGASLVSGGEDGAVRVWAAEGKS